MDSKSKLPIRHGSAHLAVVLMVLLVVGLVVAVVASQKITNLRPKATESPVTHIISPTPPLSDWLKNRSFEEDSNRDEIPDFWRKSKTLTKSDRRTSVANQDGNYSMLINGQSGTSKSLLQTLSGSWKPGAQFYLSGWVKTGKGQGGKLSIAVKARYAGGKQETFALDFSSKGPVEWTYRAGTLTLPKAAQEITIGLVVKDHVGAVYFDNIYFDSTYTPGDSAKFESALTPDDSITSSLSE